MNRFQKILGAVRRFNPAIRAKYDCAGDVFRKASDEKPALSYACRGDFRVSFRKVLAILLALVVLKLSRRK